MLHLRLILLSAISLVAGFGQLTTLTGTIKAVDGSNAQGTVVFELSASCVAPGGITVYARRTDPFIITNGVPATISLYANDSCTPSTTFYRAYWDLYTSTGTSSPQLAQTCTIAYSASPVTFPTACTDSAPPIAVTNVPITRLTGGSAKGDIIAYTGTGWVAHTGETTGCYFVRLDAASDGIDCIAPSPTSGIGDPGSNGILSRTGVNTVVARTLTGTSNEISVADGTGVSANPTFSLPSSIVLTSKIVMLPNGTATVAGDCNDAAEAGRIFVDTNQPTGEQLYVCEGAGGWVLQGSAGAGDITEVLAGVGLSGGGSVGSISLAVDSTEAGFITAGALTCGASTAGKMRVHTTPLQYCDNAGTPTLQYAAYGDSAGLATAGDSATSFFSAGALEKARQHASTVYNDAANTFSTGAQDFGAATSLEIPNGAAPTTSVFAQIAGDSDAWGASRGAPQWFDGTANVWLVGILASDTCTNGQIPRFNTGGTWTCETVAGTGDVVGGSNLTTADRIVIVSAATTVTEITTTYQQVDRCATYTIGEAALTDADTSEDEALFTLPVGGRITGVAIKHSASFTGGTISAMTVSVGTAAAPTAYSISTFSVFQAAADTTLLLADNFNSTTNASTGVIAQFNSTGGNVSAATAGSVAIEVCYVEP